MDRLTTTQNVIISLVLWCIPDRVMRFEYSLAVLVVSTAFSLGGCVALVWRWQRKLARVSNTTERDDARAVATFAEGEDEPELPLISYVEDGDD